MLTKCSAIGILLALLPGCAYSKYTISNQQAQNCKDIKQSIYLGQKEDIPLYCY